MISGLPRNLTALQSRRFASLSSLLPWYSLHGATTSNTDNKEKKLVMFFAGASLLSIKHSVRGYYRDCAAASNKTCIRGVFTCFQLSLYHDTRKTQNIPGLAKNLPCLAYYGLRSFVLIWGDNLSRPPFTLQRFLSLLPGRWVSCRIITNNR